MDGEWLAGWINTGPLRLASSRGPTNPRPKQSTIEAIGG